MTQDPSQSNSSGAQSQPLAVQWVEVDEHSAGQRVDNFLLAKLKGVPKSRIYRILRKGEVRVNKGRIKPDYKLRVGDIVRIPPIKVAERDSPAHPGQKLSQLLMDAVLYDNNDLLVINKPSGLAVHGGSGINLGLIEALRQLYPQQRFLELVHRLDRDTSGCLMVAKSRAMLLHLQQQMQSDKVSKSYQALVSGKWPKGLKEVSAPLQKNQLKSGERVVRVAEDGRRAVTHFKLLQHYHSASLIEAQLETGRTHQIRVHCQHAGHGLAGDEKYGDSAFNASIKKRGLKRMFLHAHQLVFRLPGGQVVDVQAPLTQELSALLEGLQ